MSAIIHREAVVGPDGKIEISAPELRPGQRVSITIEPEREAGIATYPPEGKIPMIDLMDEAPGQQLFKTADEVDEYLRQERESWDR
jgi:hypothetical protein